MSPTILHGNSLDVLRMYEDNAFDAIVTDPPYGLAFMGKKWDYDVPSVELWAECLRVLKPGGHLLAFAGTRTQHRMAVRIEDAGFEIRDMIAWVYGSGFPKSRDVSKAIDKEAGAEREVVGVAGRSGSARNCMAGDFAGGEYMATAPATDAARRWQGWGTALKPALEQITVARKPLIGTVAANVLAHGTGALNIDGCRVGTGNDRTAGGATGKRVSSDEGYGGAWSDAEAGRERPTGGRWPANLIHDGSDEVVALFPAQAGGQDKRKGLELGTRPGGFGNVGADTGSSTPNGRMYGDAGSAARFFYCAKASRKDREEGLGSKSGERRNNHPTVKPTDLMRYLVRLVTPPGGVVLDPFMGSGSTGKAAVLEGFGFVGIEINPEYVEIARARVQWALDSLRVA